jgi:dimethylaniline monooxygenase (N-oxide forming)
VSGERVAIVGAGPGGLVTARYLKSQGFLPVLFESHRGLGGQWNNTNNNSGVWPLMRTNTARMVTRFSDLDYPESVAVFPRNTEVLAYLEQYATQFDLLTDAHFASTVTGLERNSAGGYRLTWIGASGRQRTEHFRRVVVASGRYNDPTIPFITGLDSFAGGLGAIHAFHYKDPENYRDKKVLVAGGSISALEIASDLAMLGARSVALTNRRQRWVVPKMIAGTPIESYSLTRAGTLADERRTETENAAAQLAFLQQYAGDPARYGAPTPHPDVRKAGVTGSQHFLNLVAEARIDCRPWIDRVDGSTVTFVDGSSADFDAIVIGTGFRLHLPYLSEEITTIVEADDKSIMLADFTFHPDLDGLGFIGLWPLMGPYPVPLEQQARYLAYTWGGAIPPRTKQQLADALEECRVNNPHLGYQRQNDMAIRFARLAGTDPGGTVDLGIAALIEPTAVTSMTFRIVGVDALDSAMDIIRREAARYGRVQAADRDLV